MGVIPRRGENLSDVKVAGQLRPGVALIQCGEPTANKFIMLIPYSCCESFWEARHPPHTNN